VRGGGIVVSGGEYRVRGEGVDWGVGVGGVGGGGRVGERGGGGVCMCVGMFRSMCTHLHITEVHVHVHVSTCKQCLQRYVFVVPSCLHYQCQ